MWDHRILDPSRWGARQMILAALLGTLVVVAITAVIAMSLAPPNIYFSIQQASLQSGTAAWSFSYYNFTLVANNTGRRMEVHYGALRTEIWINATVWLPAEVDARQLLDPAKPQPPRSSSTVRGWAEFFEYNQTIKTAGVTASQAETWPNCVVVVVAKVWFRYGLACTRPYSIRVACEGVNFLNRTRYADCTA